jgi:hypothetical protein
METIIPNYTNEEFRKRFRMNRESFNSLLQDLMPYKENSIVPMEKQVLIFIKYLSSQMPLLITMEFSLITTNSPFILFKYICTLIYKQYENNEKM